MSWDPPSYRSLARAFVVVIHPDDDDCAALCKQLLRIGCRVSTMWPPPPVLPARADVVFYLEDPAGAHRHRWLVEPCTAVRIAVIAYENPVVLDAIAASNAHAVVTKPIRTFGILASVFVARTLARYEEKLLARIAKLDDTLKARRIVERATRVLSARLDLTEEAAYAAMRAEAMSRQMSISAMAESILNTENLLGKMERTND
ncbi:ANTAR domain-containing protein [Burkholderia sp. Ac-20353]|uniref:ANTAR domain-containing response regulator n=1 Tax=Burkholderia sp. Ac-20353 TaxID=2703894 RepID=UPI00197C2A61|nr:ANTAR domain-containing protein [Burkholderia sp. Ac-20353]MBN3787358.1 ANTAR domain-containing protein [Burkholderia sp. Ac-20353]